GPQFGGRVPLDDSKLAEANPNCLRLLTHWARRAASRAAWTAGRSRAMRTAMIAITTSSSISVKPSRRRQADVMTGAPKDSDGNERTGRPGATSRRRRGLGDNPARWG